MQTIPEAQVKLILTATLIFLLAPLSIVIYIMEYNRRKQTHYQEKLMMQSSFEDELTKTQLEVQEQTLQTVGINLHDNIGQILSLISITLGSIEVEGSLIQEKINSAIQLTDKSIQELRLLGKLMQGEQLIEHGLKEAITQELNWLTHSGLFVIDFVCKEDFPSQLVPDKNLIIFRMVQEILNNIMKHANATYINLKLEYHEKHLSLDIYDNGSGFNMAEVMKNNLGMGLKNMIKRTELIGGSLSIDSAEGSGTIINFKIPY